jgi:hypothetical protein
MNFSFCLSTVLIVIFLSGCETMGTIDKVNYPPRFSIINSNKNFMIVNPPTTIISDDKQTLITGENTYDTPGTTYYSSTNNADTKTPPKSVEEIVARNISRRATEAFTNAAFEKSAPKNQQLTRLAHLEIAGIESKLYVDVRRIVDEATGSYMEDKENQKTIKIMPYNWILFQNDKTARLVTVFEITYLAPDNSKKLSKAMRISNKKLKLKGESSWSENNLILSETQKNATEALSYITDSFSGKIDNKKFSEIRAIDSVLYPFTLKMTIPGKLIKSTKDLQYVYFDGIGTAIYDTNDVAIEISSFTTKN